MKKILVAIKNFFKKIVKIIDRAIVTPITHLIYKISSKFDNSSKKMENLLSKTNTLLFISLVLAVGIFVVIDQKILVFTDNTAEILKNQPVTAIYNKEAYVVEGIPEVVDITLIGSKTDLYIAKQSSNHSVTVDLSTLKPGTHKVGLTYNQSSGKIESVVNPSSVTVVIYQKVSKTMSLSVDVVNKDKLKQTLVIDNVDYDTDKVVIKGAEYQVEKVATVKALVDVASLVSTEVGTQTLKDVPLVAYDAKGNVVDVEILPGTIDVDVTISSPSKEVPIKVIPKGEVSFGLGINSIALSSNNVVVYGSKSVLDELTYIPVEIDVKGLKENMEYKVELEKPVGVTSLSINNVTVNVSLDSSTSKDFSDIRIDTRNIASGYSVQAMSEEASKVTVTAKGVKSVLDSIKSEDISAFIDLDGYTEGEYDVEVKVEGTDLKAQYASKTKKVRIKIIKKK